MGNIPIVTSQISARSGRSTVGGPRVYATGDAFGAQTGRALEGFGQQLSGAAGDLYAYQEKKRQETVVNKVAQADFTPHELETRNEVGPDGAGYHERTLAKYDTWVDEQANTIEDDIARTDFRNKMIAKRAELSSRSAVYEFQLAGEYSKEQANASLMSLENKILSDPSQYETYIQDGFAVLDTRDDVPAALREGMKRSWRQDSARARFNGMLERATSVEDVDDVVNELTQKPTSRKGETVKDWASEFKPEDYQKMLNDAGVVRKAIITKADADARAAIDTIEARAEDVTTLIPQEELAAVQRVVKQTQNPVTLARMARISRNQAIIKESRKLPPRELRAQVNATNGNPGVAYPGVPPRVSSAINTATSKFDVSASYLGATVQREYGQYLKRGPAKTNAQYAPVPLHKGVDIRNVRPDVVDAATVAGELFGAPLNITSGHRSQARQDAIRASGDPSRVTVARKSHHTSGTGLDISTVGMSPEDKAKLAGALVDAGFTGIGEYDTHIHADMRNAVPASFGERGGRTWGGWTYLSPEVSKELLDRGFGAGATNDKIRRGAPVQYADDIDYGRGTSIVDENGVPTTNALGIMQFIPGTFIEVMRDPSVAQRIGIDTSVMNDEQLLELRKDPDIAIQAGAAYAEKNKSIMQRSLGRTVTDAELHMAHFLGAGGAMSLLKARDMQPQQSAAKLLPNAAKANKRIFFDGNRQRTVDEVYNNIARSFVAEPSKVAYDDNQTRQKLIDTAEKNLASDPMSHAANVGSHSVSPLDGPGGFAARGEEARAVADYYDIPAQDMKPLTEEELNGIKRTMDEGSADDVLATLTSMTAMGGDMTRAALKQLDQKDSVYAYAAGLQLEYGRGDVSGDIVRGRKRLEENEAIKTQIGAEQSDVDTAFTGATGGALMQIAPNQRQAIQEAALAHYVETHFARGGVGAFDSDAFGRSVQAVLGGDRGTPAVAEVNGELTVLPPGVTGGEMEQALHNMTVDDWAKLSDQKLPPRYRDGTIIAPEDLADEARLRIVGGRKYTVQLDDGTFAITGRVQANGRYETYVFNPNPDTINEIASRPAREIPDSYEAPGEAPVGYAPPPSNILGNFDESGRWTGPSR